MIASYDSGSKPKKTALALEQVLDLRPRIPRNAGSRHKGGSFRKWFGNHEFVVDWENDGVRIRNFFDGSFDQNLEYYFRPAATWTSLTVGSFNARICRGGFVYDAKGGQAD
ncbi:MAG: hypothetical protein JKP98_12995 [Rhodobacteraceae bacterium]|nr:hypothetical protein [Paracoccaceae bacterium]